jgi:hypothetical protein
VSTLSGSGRPNSDLERADQRQSNTVEVPEEVECEAGETGWLAGIDCVDPGRERVAEIADVSGGRVQFGAAGQHVFQADAVLLV